MNQQIATQYNNYQELLIDLDIFGRQNEPKQLDLQGYEELFYEEFKQRKPMPTMESKRYKLSRLVDNDYCVEYNKQIELREKEYLIDLTEHSEKKNEKETYEIVDEVQDLFTYERQIKNSDREEIIKKYSLDTGESLDYTQIERPDKLLGTIKADESLKLDEIEIENLGSDNPVFHDEEVEPIETETTETKETEEIEDLEDYELADLDDDFDEVENSEEEQDSSTSSITANNTDVEENSSTTNDSDEEKTSSTTNSNTENSSTSSNDLSLDSLLQMLEKKIDANIDIEQLKALVKESEKPKAEESEESSAELDIEEEPIPDSDSDKEFIQDSDSIEEAEESNIESDNEKEPSTESSSVEETEESEETNTESSSREEPDTLDEFFEEEEEAISNSETDSTDSSNKQDFDIDVDDFEMDFDEDEEKPKKPKVVEQKPQVVVEEKPKVQEVVEQKQEEPKDLREFIRKHPRCEYDFATQYFTPKQIAMEIKKGRVIKRGNLLKI